MLSAYPISANQTLFSFYQKECYKLLYFGMLSGINNNKIEGKNSKFWIEEYQSNFPFGSASDFIKDVV